LKSALLSPLTVRVRIGVTWHTPTLLASNYEFIGTTVVHHEQETEEEQGMKHFIGP